jgi:FKBP-type peptidyl-prolyl cis-trans isomerase 2
MPTRRATADRDGLTAAKPADATRSFTATDWGHIPWRQVERDVRRLQHRIEILRIEVTPEEGYGPVDPQKRQEVDKTKIPEEARKIGAKLTGQTPDGKMVFAQVSEIKDNTIVLDLNHPLAGKKLFFDIKLLKVESQLV